MKEKRGENYMDYLDKLFSQHVRSVYKELHADHETGAADNK